MQRTECAGCGHPGLTVFADLGETPLADVFESDPASAIGLPRYPLRAATCDKCGLAQLLDVVDDKLLYGDDYGFRTGGSPSSLAYMKGLAEFAHGIAPPGRVVEIGCNDGTLMGEFRALGRNVTGIDPSGATGRAYDQGLSVIREPFTAELARASQFQAALVVAVNVAAHVQDPHDFLEGVAALLAPDGVAVVEFQYLPDLLAGCMFDLIYHEHRFFYTVDSFGRLAADHGLSIKAAGHMPAQGGSYRVVLSKTRHERIGGLERYEQESLPGLLAGFQRRAWYARNRICDVVGTHDGTVYGYAASAKSCTLLNFCGLGSQQLPYIIDATPAKYGRFAPGTGIEILGAPTLNHPDAYLLLASNYLGGIVRREQAAGYQGEFIVPLPLPVIV